MNFLKLQEDIPEDFVCDFCEKNLKEKIPRGHIAGWIDCCNVQYGISQNVLMGLKILKPFGNIYEIKILYNHLTMRIGKKINDDVTIYSYKEITSNSFKGKTAKYFVEYCQKILLLL